jgi:hypothetical protein
VQALMADKEKLEKELRRLNDKLAFTLSDCNTKDEHMKKQTMIVQEAVLGNVHALIRFVSCNSALLSSLIFIHCQYSCQSQTFLIYLTVILD